MQSLFSATNILIMYERAPTRDPWPRQGWIQQLLAWDRLVREMACFNWDFFFFFFSKLRNLYVWMWYFEGWIVERHNKKWAHWLPPSDLTGTYTYGMYGAYAQQATYIISSGPGYKIQSRYMRKALICSIYSFLFFRIPVTNYCMYSTYYTYLMWWGALSY